MSRKVPRNETRKIVLNIWVINALALIFGAHESYAQCDCIGSTPANDYRGSPYRTAYDELKGAEIVFIGEVLKRSRVDLPPPHRDGYSYEHEVTFKIKRVWKKEADEIVNVREGGPCVLGYEKGDEVLVYAHANRGGLRIHFCSRTRLLSKSSADLKEFEERGITPEKIKSK